MKCSTLIVLGLTPLDNVVLMVVLAKLYIVGHSDALCCLEICPITNFRKKLLNE
jgi:hypothetical protein